MKILFLKSVLNYVKSLVQATITHLVDNGNGGWYRGTDGNALLR